MAGPTNTEIHTAPLEADLETTIREDCRLRGCTCGRDLEISVRVLEDDERPPEMYGYAQASQAEIRHSMSCPMLAQMHGRN